MGFDVYGKQPEGQPGNYFRNNCWWWRPLWKYAAMAVPDVITERRAEAGQYNDGHRFTATEAEKIGSTLLTKVIDGSVKKYAAEYEAARAALPDERCTYCQGTGDRKDLGPPEWKAQCGGCNVCHGTGKHRPSDAAYPFSEENVKEFAEFCLASGGFEIC